jgi:hypothetical protein
MGKSQAPPTEKTNLQFMRELASRHLGNDHIVYAALGFTETFDRAGLGEKVAIGAILTTAAQLAHLPVLAIGGSRLYARVRMIVVTQKNCAILTFRFAPVRTESHGVIKVLQGEALPIIWSQVEAPEVWQRPLQELSASRDGTTLRITGSPHKEIVLACDSNDHSNAVDVLVQAINQSLGLPTINDILITVRKGLALSDAGKQPQNISNAYVRQFSKDFWLLDQRNFPLSLWNSARWRVVKACESSPEWYRLAIANMFQEDGIAARRRQISGYLLVILGTALIMFFAFAITVSVHLQNLKQDSDGRDFIGFVGIMSGFVGVIPFIFGAERLRKIKCCRVAERRLRAGINQSEVSSV